MNFKIFKRRFWYLLGIPILTVAASYFLISEMGDRYRSTAQIATGFTTDDAVKLSDAPATPFDVSTNFTNVIESMNSVPVLSLVSYRLVIHDLEDKKPFRVFDDSKERDIIIDEKSMTKALGLFKEKLKDIKTLNLFDTQDQMLFAILKGYGYDAETISKDLRIRRLENSDFISVDYVSENPFLSALTVNVVCQEFIRYNKTLKTDRSSESIEFLKNLADEKKRILDEKSAALKSFKLDNNVFSHDAETKNKIALITDYELNRDREANTINRLEFSIRKLESNMEIKSKNLGKANRQETLLVNERILEIRRKINELMSSNDSNKSRLSQLRDELQLETSRLDALSANEKAEQEFREMEKERDDLKMDLQIARNNLSSIDQSLRKLKSDVAGSASKEMSTTDLDREVELATNEYIAAQDKYNAAKNKSLVIGSSMRQILQGQPSYEPESSQAALIMGLSGAGGFVLALLGVVAFEFMDNSIRVAPRLEKFTGIPAIGTVNLLKEKDFNLREVFNDRSSNKEYEMFSHFLRKLRYEVQSSGSKVFLVTSTQVKTGKSFLIVSLSYALSLVHAKVLIIDTNFRHNSLTKALLPRMDSRKLLKKGIIDEEDDDDLMLEEHNFNSHEDDSEEEIENRLPATTATGQRDLARNLINRTKFAGVDIIGNVGANDSPSEIMAGRDFHEMIRNLSERYDCVLMEGPALNNYSDSKELIDYADKVIPVFAADASINHHDRDSIKYFKSINGKLMGSVLNKVKFKHLTL